MAKRIMGLDLGDRTIGVALTDPEWIIASPYTTIRRLNLARDLEALKAIIQEQNVGEIVIGMPRSLSGELHFQAELTGRFIEELKRAVSIPVKTWDERFSTAEAGRMLSLGEASRHRRKRMIDQTAAAIILQGYMAFRKNSRV